MPAKIKTSLPIFSFIKRSARPKRKDILATAEELTNPHLNDLSKITSSADILLVDEAFDKGYILGVTRFDLKKIKAKSKCPVEVVNEGK